MFDDKFHEVFNSGACYVPAHDIRCRNCRTRLKVYYAENRLYSVKCGYCETLTLVKASNPTEAMRYVGEYAEREEQT